MPLMDKLIAHEGLKVLIMVIHGEDVYDFDDNGHRRWRMKDLNVELVDVSNLGGRNQRVRLISHFPLTMEMN